MVIQYGKHMFLRDGNSRVTAAMKNGKASIKARVVYVPENPQSPRRGVSNCGGEGGTPGPCPTGSSLKDISDSHASLSHDEIAAKVAEHFKGKSAAESIEAAKAFGIHVAKGRKHAIELVTRRISDRKESAERVAEIGAKPLKVGPQTQLPESVAPKIRHKQTPADPRFPPLTNE